MNFTLNLSIKIHSPKMLANRDPSQTLVRRLLNLKFQILIYFVKKKFKAYQ